jgi:hypothetical protein
MYEILFFQLETKLKICVEEKGKEICVYKIENIEEPLKLWILVRNNELRIGQGNFFENYDFLLFCDQKIKEISCFGWYAETKPIFVKSIHISRQISRVLASRDHILEIISDNLDEKKIKDWFGKELEKIVEIKENKAIVVMVSVKEAVKAIMHVEEFKANLLRFSSSRMLGFLKIG